MADFLTINGVPYPVQVQGASQSAPEYSGSRERAMAGNMRSTRTVVTKKDSWQFVIGPISPAAYAVLVADTEGDQIVPVDGAAMQDAAVDCMVDINDARFVRDGTQAHNREVQITVYEV
jgi:hypothetical protein